MAAMVCESIVPHRAEQVPIYTMAREVGIMPAVLNTMGRDMIPGPITLLQIRANDPMSSMV